LTSALYGSEWLATCTGGFISGKLAPVSIGKGAGWAPEPVWILCKIDKSSLCWDSKPGHLASSPSLCRLS
jgi:hypothetical protein